MNTITKTFLLGSLLATTALPGVAAAAHPDLTITPVVIDLKGEPRDILSASVTLTNTGSRRLNLYGAVRNVLPKEGEQQFVGYQESDKSRSLANWIHLSRGVIEIEPGQSRDIPIEIRVDLNAKVGIYHAQMTFAEGATRDAAESPSAPGVSAVVNLEITEKINELMQLRRFAADKNIAPSFPADFTFELENIGNKPQDPYGSIRIYDRRGREVAEVELADMGTMQPDQLKEFGAAWNGDGGKPGKYKAVLSVRFGAQQPASVQDTVFFWYMPWYWVAAGVTLLVLPITLLFIYMHGHQRRYANLHAHLQATYKKLQHVQTQGTAPRSAPGPATPRSAVHKGRVVDIAHRKPDAKHE